MNHVAHCLLSVADPDLLLGNFIGDFVKGKAWQDFAPGIQRGILLHRAIDAFTDEHPAIRDSVARLRPYAGRYTAPVVDVLYDHLLCLEWERVSPDLPFDDFARWVYDSLDQRAGDMPAELQRRWPHMLNGRFLDGYRSRRGLEWALGLFNRRLEGRLAVPELTDYFFGEIDVFLSDFRVFFPDLDRHVQQFRGQQT